MISLINKIATPIKSYLNGTVENDLELEKMMVDLDFKKVNENLDQGIISSEAKVLATDTLKEKLARIWVDQVYDRVNAMSHLYHSEKGDLTLQQQNWKLNVDTLSESELKTYLIDRTKQVFGKHITLGMFACATINISLIEKLISLEALEPMAAEKQHHNYCDPMSILIPFNKAQSLLKLKAIIASKDFNKSATHISIGPRWDSLQNLFFRTFSLDGNFNPKEYQDKNLGEFLCGTDGLKEGMSYSFMRTLWG